MTSRLKKIITMGIICLVLAAGLGICANKWAGEKMQKVVLGLAEPNFPYRDYTEDELAKMYPQIRYADVPTRVTPEQTYANFREALRTNNLDLALEQLGRESGEYKQNKDDLIQAHQENRFNDIYQSYPEAILQESISETLSQFYFNYKEGNLEKTHFINFIKDANGDWKLDSL